MLANSFPWTINSLFCNDVTCASSELEEHAVKQRVITATMRIVIFFIKWCIKLKCKINYCRKYTSNCMKKQVNRCFFIFFNNSPLNSNYSAIMNVEYQEFINIILWQKDSKWHSLPEFVCTCLCNLLIISNSLYALSLNSYVK